MLRDNHTDAQNQSNFRYLADQSESIFSLVIKILVNSSYTLTNFNRTALENVDVTTYILHPLQCQCRSLHCKFNEYYNFFSGNLLLKIQPYP